MRVGMESVRSFCPTRELSAMPRDSRASETAPVARHERMNATAVHLAVATSPLLPFGRGRSPTYSMPFSRLKPAFAPAPHDDRKSASARKNEEIT